MVGLRCNIALKGSWCDHLGCGVTGAVLTVCPLCLQTRVNKAAGLGGPVFFRDLWGEDDYVGVVAARPGGVMLNAGGQ